MSKSRKVDKKAIIKELKKQFQWKQSVKIDGNLVKVESLVVNGGLFERVIRKSLQKHLDSI